MLAASWSRWVDILHHGHFKKKIGIEDIKTISRAMVSAFVLFVEIISCVTLNRLKFCKIKSLLP